MRGANLDFHGDLLAGGEAVDFSGVGEGNAFAVPHTAVGMRALEVLESTLDVTVVVGVLLVEDLVSTGGFEAIAWKTRGGAGYEAVSGDRGGQARKGDDRCEGLHGDGWLQRWWREKEC